jgi:SOS-response transcriptional repressor LexA
METLKDVVCEQRERLGLSLRQVSIKSGISHSMINKIERGEIKGRPSPEVLERLERGLRFPAGYLQRLAGYNFSGGMLGRGESVEGTNVVASPPSTIITGTMRAIPILGSVKVSDDLVALEQAEKGFVMLPEDSSATIDRALRVHDSSMAPDKLEPGYLALISFTEPVQSGDIVAVLIRSKDIVLRRMEHNGDEVVLRPSDPKAPLIQCAEDDIAVFGKVVGFVGYY